MTYKERRERLRRGWGFSCTCKLCTASQEERIASDGRRLRLKTIRDEVMTLVGQADYQSAIKLYKENMEMGMQEQLIPHFGEHYEVLARLYGALPNRYEAIKYTRLAIREMEKYGGTEVYQSITELKEMLQKMEEIAWRLGNE